MPAGSAANAVEVETDINPNKIRTKAVLKKLNSETLAVIVFFF